MRKSHKGRRQKKEKKREEKASQETFQVENSQELVHRQSSSDGSESLIANLTI